MKLYASVGGWLRVAGLLGVVRSWLLGERRSVGKGPWHAWLPVGYGVSVSIRHFHLRQRRLGENFLFLNHTVLVEQEGGERVHLMAPAHSHDRYEETVYGIDGVLTWTVDGKLIDVGPGQALCIPRGAVPRFDFQTLSNYA